jgi:hypothetical protein
MIVVLLLVVSCIAHEQNVGTYVKGINKLLNTWIQNPTENNYHALHFYMHANKPSSQIHPATQEMLEKKLRILELNNPQLFKCCLAQEVTYGALYCMPPQCAPVVLVTDLLITSNIAGNCKQLNQEQIIQEIKDDIRKISIKSRKPIPKSPIMNKNEN